MDPILDNLNDEQRKAVLQQDGAVLIIAGAGSGKTRVLTSKIALLLRDGVLPEELLALTFTRKAAGEMKVNNAKLEGDYWTRMPFSQTLARCLYFNSGGVRPFYDLPARKPTASAVG